MRWPGATLNLNQRVLPGSSMMPVADNCVDAEVMSSAFGHESLSAALARHCEAALGDGVVSLHGHEVVRSDAADRYAEVAVRIGGGRTVSRRRTAAGKRSVGATCGGRGLHRDRCVRCAVDAADQEGVRRAGRNRADQCRRGERRLLPRKLGRTADRVEIESQTDRAGVPTAERAGRGGSDPRQDLDVGSADAVLRKARRRCSSPGQDSVSPPLRSWSRPEPMSEPFLYSSARRSNCVP